MIRQTDGRCTCRPLKKMHGPHFPLLMSTNSALMQYHGFRKVGPLAARMIWLAPCRPRALTMLTFFCFFLTPFSVCPSTGSPPGSHSLMGAPGHWRT